MAAKKPPVRRVPFTRDEMSTGKGSKLKGRAATVVASPKSGTFPTLKVEPLSASQSAVRDEIRYRERLANNAIAGPVLAKARPRVADTFAQQKMKEAEANLPDWASSEFDDEIYPDDEVAEEEDPDKTDPGLEPPRPTVKK
jgi:hypothetical protein